MKKLAKNLRDGDKFYWAGEIITYSGDAPREIYPGRVSGFARYSNGNGTPLNFGVKEKVELA